MTKQDNIRKSTITVALILVLASILGMGSAAAASKELTFEEATAFALKEVSGTVTQAELDYRGRKLVYEIEILDKNNKEHDIDIDGETGEVLNHHTSYRTTPTNTAKKLRGAKITATKAVAAVKKETGATMLVSYELDIENGKVYWEVTMMDKDNIEYDAVVDASTGKVVYVESEYDD